MADQCALRFAKLDTILFSLNAMMEAVVTPAGLRVAACTLIEASIVVNSRDVPTLGTAECLPAAGNAQRSVEE